MTMVLNTERQRETGDRRHKLRTAWLPQKLEEAGRTPPEGLQRELSPSATLTSDPWPPEPQESNPLLFEGPWFVAVCYSRPRALVILSPHRPTLQGRGLRPERQALPGRRVRLFSHADSKGGQLQWGRPKHLPSGPSQKCWPAPALGSESDTCSRKSKA